MRRLIFSRARPGGLPEPDITLERELVAVSHLIREVGEALESVAETLADGIVEEGELRITIPKLEAVIA